MIKQTYTAMIFRATILLIVSLVSSQLAFASRGLPDFTDLVDANGPAVVNISTVQSVKAKNKMKQRMPEFPEGSPFGEWFKRFFDEEGGPDGFNGEDHKAQSLGSGFIISKDGYILTNNHVVEDADKIIVRLSDRREIDAELIGRDERSDLAVLKIKAEDLPVVKIGDSSKLKPGEWVLAIGSPFGFDYSVTAGIVSAKGRSLPKENYVPFIQTDVAINPGNSGGPLFNLDGEVVGINSQIYSRTGGYMGVSFAIPINIAMTVVEQLKKDGVVKRGWLGVLIQDVTRDLAESFNMDKPQGALVARVLPSSPAEEAGFQVGDIVLKFNGQEIDHSSDLPPMVGITPIDRKVPVEIIRNGKKQTLSVKIGELPKEEEVKVATHDPEVASADRIGLVVTNIPDDLREKMEINSSGGVIVKQVENGPAKEAGIHPGDVIQIINNEEIKDADHFKVLVDGLPAGKPVPVLVQQSRGGSSFLVIRIPEKE